MAEVEEAARRAHRPKCPCRDHVYLCKGTLFAEFRNDLRHLLGGDHPCISLLYPFVYLVDGLAHGMIFKNEYL